MKVAQKTIKQGNEVIYRYTKNYITYSSLHVMYDELKSIGVSVGLIYGDNKTCEWYYNGIEVDNSLFYYSIYKNEDGSRFELTSYLS